jgi:hypothetical protein
MMPTLRTYFFSPRLTVLLAVMLLGVLALGPTFADGDKKKESDSKVKKKSRFRTRVADKPEPEKNTWSEGDRKVEVGEGIKAARSSLAVFPIYESGGPRTHAYEIISFAEAMATGKFKVEEKGSVGEVEVTNNTGKYVTILSGEMIFGGRQDRIVAYDRLIPPEKDKKVPVKVFCVEAGRWASGDAPGKKSGDFSCGRSRKKLSSKSKKYGRDVYDNLVNRGLSLVAYSSKYGQKGGGQSGIWDNVRKANKKLGTVNSSSTYRRNLTNAKIHARAAAMVKPIADKLVPDGKVIGYACAMNGKVMFMNVFCNPAMAERYKRRLLKSYALEIMIRGRKGGGGSVNAKDVARFMNMKDNVVIVEEEGEVKTVKVIQYDPILRLVKKCWKKPVVKDFLCNRKKPVESPPRVRTTIRTNSEMIMSEISIGNVPVHQAYYRMGR